MRTGNSIWDNIIIFKAWALIICIAISHTLDVHSATADTVSRSNSTTSSNETNSQDSFNIPFSFLMPGEPLNGSRTESLLSDSTESPELTTKQKQTSPTTTPFKARNVTIVGNSATDFAKQETTSSTTAQPEVTTDGTIYSTITTDIAQPTTSLSKSVSTQINSASAISNSTVGSRQTTSTSGLTSFSTFGLASFSTARLISSTSGLVSAKISAVTNKQTITSSRTNHTTHLANVNTTINSTDEFYNSTADPSRLTRTFSDDFESRDSFWPIALALTIGIPTIVVLAVTITVLYRRRIAKPRSLLSMYGQDYFQN
ncbi:uncharacterized protein LOC123565596 [Mercenaria mercenaria]|uniref:uncharacterized protein LOC123565596 n=1 Tax=Mercenaria mercenaria TaxID=6596 RepID=UPI00234EF994|nr:uncharacterized protein LOC123565596 [Mercenaria mercenaria]